MVPVVSPNSNIIKPIYSVTSNGKVYSHRRDKFLSMATDKNGYKVVTLMCESGKTRTFFVHRLVLAAYDPRDGMDSLQVNHIDGHKDNNNISNLEWCTCMENIHHAMDNGLLNIVGEKHFRSLITDEQAREVRKRLNRGERIIHISREMNVPYTCVAKIKSLNYYRNAV